MPEGMQMIVALMFQFQGSICNWRQKDILGITIRKISLNQFAPTNAMWNDTNQLNKMQNTANCPIKNRKNVFIPTVNSYVK